MVEYCHQLRLELMSRPGHHRHHQLASAPMPSSATTAAELWLADLKRAQATLQVAPPGCVSLYYYRFVGRRSGV